jgi:hypothetical protein
MLHNVHVVTTVSTLVSSSGSFGRALDEFIRTQGRARDLARNRQQRWRGIETNHTLHFLRVKWQIETGADADFKHSTFRGRDDKQ